MLVGLVALPAREEAALRFYISRNMKGWRGEPVSFTRGVVLAQADVYVLDLAGAGLQRNLEAGDRDVASYLNGRPTVLLAPAFDTSWNGPESPLAQNAMIAVLNKPIRSEELRAALEGLARKAAAMPVAQPVSAPPSRQPESLGKPVLASVRLSAMPAVPVVDQGMQSPQSLPTDREVGLDAIRQRLERTAAQVRPRFLGALLQALSGASAVEMRLTVNNVVIVDATDRWVASNTPMAVIERLCSSSALASVVNFRVLDDEDPLGRAHRLGLPVEPLEPFLARLEKASFGEKS